MATSLGTDRIDDAGAFLPGAKKEGAHRPGSSKASTNLLSQLWPEPDWSSCIADGMAPGTAALLAMLYQGFSTGPMRDGAWALSAEVHRAHYDACLASMRRLFEQASNEDIEALRARFHVLTGVPRSIKGLDITQLLPLYALGRYGGRKIGSPLTLTTRSAYLAKALPDLGWPQDSGALKTSICFYELKDKGTFGVARFAGAGITVLVQPPLHKQRAIEESRRLIAEELTGRAEDRKRIPKKGNATDMDRSGGKDVRAGSDVNAEDVMRRYRLRAIQFGESLTQPERQRWLNATFDAMEDLSVATGLPPAWLGLSKLGLALGARGNAGAAAHYEPCLRVFNLTRLNGAGSLAHEWAHGLDHHLSVHTLEMQRYSNSHFLTQQESQLSYLQDKSMQKWPIAKTMLRILHYMRWGAIPRPAYNAMSDFYRAASDIEKIKGARKQYWTSPTEMFARAFEAMVQDRLTSIGVHSPWLVHGTRAIDLPPKAAADPYPQGEDRRILGCLIQELIEAIKQVREPSAPPQVQPPARQFEVPRAEVKSATPYPATTTSFNPAEIQW